jgi:hypothetical protein
MTHKAWLPLVEWTRLRHLRFRERLAGDDAAGLGRRCSPAGAANPPAVVSAGV